MALFHSYTIAEEHHYRHLHCPSMDEGAHREPPQYCRHDRLVITTEGVEGNRLAWCLIDFTAIVDFFKKRRELQNRVYRKRRSCGRKLGLYPTLLYSHTHTQLVNIPLTVQKISTALVAPLHLVA